MSQKVVMLSRIARVCVHVLFYALPLAIVWYWFVHIGPRYIDLGLTPSDSFHFSNLKLWQKLVGFVVTMIPGGIGMFVLANLRKLFTNYQQQQIFTQENCRYLRYVAIALMFWEVIRPLYDMLIGYVVTYLNGNFKVIVVIDITNVRSLLFAAVLYVIASVMEEGCRLKEESDYTI